MLTELVSCLVPVQEATGEQPSVADHHNDCPSLQLHKRPLSGKSATQYCNCHLKNLGHSRSITCTCFSSPLVFHLHQFFSNAHLYQKYGECIDWLPLTFDLIMLPAWDTMRQRSKSASVAVAVKSTVVLISTSCTAWMYFNLWGVGEKQVINLQWPYPWRLL